MHKTLFLTAITLLSIETICHAMTIDYVVTDGTKYATIGFSQANGSDSAIWRGHFGKRAVIDAIRGLVDQFARWTLCRVL